MSVLLRYFPPSGYTLDDMLWKTLSDLVKTKLETALLRARLLDWVLQKDARDVLAWE